MLETEKKYLINVKIGILTPFWEIRPIAELNNQVFSILVFFHDIDYIPFYLFRTYSIHFAIYIQNYKG